MAARRSPPTGSPLEESAVDELRRAGFTLLQREVELGGDGTKKQVRFHADIVAWAPDAKGELRPQVLVEVRRADGVGEGALAQLAAYADLLAVQETFVFDGLWHR